MMLSLSVNVFAAEPLTDDPNMIEWKYTVFADESLQKVVEEGVIPNAYARYTWRGITLKNGEVAILTPSNNSMGRLQKLFHPISFHPLQHRFQIPVLVHSGNAHKGSAGQIMGYGPF